MAMQRESSTSVKLNPYDTDGVGKLSYLNKILHYLYLKFTSKHILKYLKWLYYEYYFTIWFAC